MRLKGTQAEELKKALLSGFYDQEDFEKLVRLKLDERLKEIVKLGTTDTIAFNLIEWAEQNDRLDDLLAAAMAERPRNPALRRMALAISLTSDVPPTGKLETTLLPGVGYPDVATWRARMEQIERTVCLVELASGQAIGTGFLVAPDVIMTNHHVAHPLDGGPPPVAARFDFRTDAAGKPLPADHTQAFADPWLIAESPLEELDYALIRLATRLDDRTFLRAGAHTLIVDEPLFVIQHPLTQRLKLGVGSVRKVDHTPPRVFYTANTEPGSSGSPCFTIQWDLVALHHQGDTGSGANNGIPMRAIVGDVQQRGKASALGW